MNDHRTAKRPRSSLRVFGVFLAIVAAIAGVEFYALWAHNKDRTSVPASAGTQVAGMSVPLPVGPVGAIDQPVAEAVVGPRFATSGWALAASGVRAVEIRLDGKTFPATIGIARADVAAVRTEYRESARSGFEWSGDLSAVPAAPGADRREIAIVAIDNEGHETVLGRRSLIEPNVFTRWSEFTPRGATPFYLLPALSGLDLNAGAELDTLYAPYLSPTTRAGFRVPILYLRMTRGAAQDYAFDPDWDPRQMCGKRRIGDDSLHGVLAFSAQKNLPILVTLNGGIWADAYCDVPQWDINDRLEQEPANCQWNQNNEVMPDDYLKNLPGSQDAPELARSLTFNVYARNVRHYKKRNLQQAGAVLARFAREHPGLFVGVNLDPDTYLNPFFAEAQWFDYNPGTLRQFREWLSGSGPYAGKPEPGVPDLSAYRRTRALSLAEVRRIAGKPFPTWNDVDPPRVFSREPGHEFWRNPWVQEWEHFRRHLIALHYNELAQWLVAVGIPSANIWSAQGFMAPAGDAMPFALDIDSPVKNFDSGGMSVAGAKPALGHLGAILYGAAAVNDVRMENGRTLFANFAAIDPHWAIVEFNTADLRAPHAQPSFTAGYRGLRDLWNYGARYVSPMAWNGSNGIFAGTPGYSTFTAWRNTPLEEAARDFLLARAGLPRDSLLWTFGTARHADDDGWQALDGTLALAPGRLELTPDAQGKVTLLSPNALPPQATNATNFVVGIARDAGLARIRVLARSASGAPWVAVADSATGPLRFTEAGAVISRKKVAGSGALDQLRIELEFAGAQSRTIARIAAMP